MLPNLRSMVCSWLALAALLPAQTPAPAKGPDKEVAQKLATLKDVVHDKKMARDDEGRETIDWLLKKVQEGGLDPKDQQAITKGLDGVFTQGKVRPAEAAALYVAAAAALGYCGADGAKALKNAYTGKRLPDKPPYVPLREQLLKGIGKTKDESMVKFLIDEARRSPEAALQAAAGEALGHFDDSKETLRKQIVEELLIKYGELSELASQLGSANIEAQNARDRLAALKDKWDTTLGKLTRQNHRTYLDWQSWYNKHKGQPW